MSLLLIFAFAVFSALTVFMMVSPFLGSREAQVRTEVLETEMKRIEQLIAKKAVLVNSLRELQFEYETSKVTDSDYKLFRSRYERQAVGVMRELDSIHGGRGWEERIDAEIQQRIGNAEPSETADEVSGTADVVCAKCGDDLEADDKFCGQCGAVVGADVEATA